MEEAEEIRGTLPSRRVTTPYAYQSRIQLEEARAVDEDAEMMGLGAEPSKIKMGLVPEPSSQQHNPTVQLTGDAESLEGRSGAPRMGFEPEPSRQQHDPRVRLTGDANAEPSSQQPDPRVRPLWR